MICLHTSVAHQLCHAHDLLHNAHDLISCLLRIGCVAFTIQLHTCRASAAYCSRFGLQCSRFVCVTRTLQLRDAPDLLAHLLRISCVTLTIRCTMLMIQVRSVHDFAAMHSGFSSPRKSFSTISTRSRHPATSSRPT